MVARLVGGCARGGPPAPQGSRAGGRSSPAGRGGGWRIRLGIRGRVVVLESDRVSVAVVVGWLRPAVILPKGLIYEVSPASIAAVLLHELGHIRRGDYGWNLVRKVVQALYWPHPLTWPLTSADRDRSRAGMRRPLRSHDGRACGLLGFIAGGRRGPDPPPGDLARPGDGADLAPGPPPRLDRPNPRLGHLPPPLARSPGHIVGVPQLARPKAKSGAKRRTSTARSSLEPVPFCCRQAQVRQS